MNKGFLVSTAAEVCEGRGRAEESDESGERASPPPPPSVLLLLLLLLPPPLSPSTQLAVAKVESLEVLAVESVLAVEVVIMAAVVLGCTAPQSHEDDRPPCPAPPLPTWA